ncbi:MAG: hypothetical protein KDK99_04115 [Verrucomicrobiales bacterium]|nr:hypothetical protein [Verrucomicrobiales bacterium]
MFKKVLQSLSKSLSGNKSAPPPPKKAAKDKNLLDRVTKGPPAPQRDAAPARSTGGGGASILSRSTATPEELCEIKPGMSKGQIHDRLKLLYRRFNRSASSLDASTREEAERMLDAIVQVREKHLGPI